MVRLCKKTKTFKNQCSSENEEEHGIPVETESISLDNRDELLQESLTDKSITSQQICASSHNGCIHFQFKKVLRNMGGREGGGSWRRGRVGGGGELEEGLPT